jgi:hypothetical protein
VATKGSAHRAEMNPTLRARCVSCGKSIPTETGNAHPLDEALRRETYGLVGNHAGKKTIFATCTACHDAGSRPEPFLEYRERSYEPPSVQR